MTKAEQQKLERAHVLSARLERQLRATQEELHNTKRLLEIVCDRFKIDDEELRLMTLQAKCGE